MSKYLLIALLILFISCDKDKSTSLKKAKWIENAFVTLNSDKYPKIKAISWWHENFDNSLLRIDSSPESLEAYKKGVADTLFISNTAHFINNKLTADENGIYHAAFPDFGGTEDMVSRERILAFESLVKKNIVWAYFSNNWYTKIQFPKTEVELIRNAGKLPFIRLMPRSNFDEGGPDPNYTMQKIINGDFDTELIQWAKDAAASDIPLLAEFGTEMNGNWFPWNGQYNGGEVADEYGALDLPDGPERFRDAYRHIIDLCRQNGANNITWFFHVDAYGEPDAAWNNIQNYYPGDEYIDWLGVSIYGPQERDEDYQEFEEILDDIYPKLTALSDKPVAILEFAITEM
ncbi:MAG: glycoside hydrolase family 26 protein [Bacteroidales bacterium]|nr:glycoside hydrolase family 26 protein [Bacteroidales bacterium]